MQRRTVLKGGAAMGLTLAAGMPAMAQDGPLKVGFIYVGPIGDGGWTFQHDQGRLAVVEAFGDKVETVYQESVPEGADAERVLTQMALSGCGLRADLHDIVWLYGPDGGGGGKVPGHQV